MTELESAIRKIVKQVLAEELSGTETEQKMIEEYGEMISRGDAAKLLDVVPGTITAMCKDGRLSGTPMGVSVRSIAKYLDAGRPSAQRIKRMRPMANQSFTRFRA